MKSLTSAAGAALAALLVSPASALWTIPNCTAGPLSTNGVCNQALDPSARAVALVNAMNITEKLANLVEYVFAPPPLQARLYQCLADVKTLQAAPMGRPGSACPSTSGGPRRCTASLTRPACSSPEMASRSPTPRRSRCPLCCPLLLTTIWCTPLRTRSAPSSARTATRAGTALMPIRRTLVGDRLSRLMPGIALEESC
jgi:hypothetical protein